MLDGVRSGFAHGSRRILGSARRTRAESFDPPCRVPQHLNAGRRKEVVADRVVIVGGSAVGGHAIDLHVEFPRAAETKSRRYGVLRPGMRIGT